MKPIKDYTLILLLALFAVATLCSCNVAKKAGNCPTTNSKFFYQNR